MTLEEVERRLRAIGASSPVAYSGDATELADAIRAHRERCVDLELLRAMADCWRLAATARTTMTGGFPAGYAQASLEHARAVESLMPPPLPPQKSALQRLRELVEDKRSGLMPDVQADALALLREAEKEAANGA